jgi:hypothetical protein
MEEFTDEEKERSGKFQKPSEPRKFYADSEGTVHTNVKIETPAEKEAKIKVKLAELKGLKNFNQAKENF